MSAKPRPTPEDQIDLQTLDLGYLSLFVGLAFADKVQEKMAAEGFGDLRFSHGFIFQHLLGAERTVGEIAARLEITQQAASKVILELEGLGYLERVPDASDRRVRKVRLTKRGQAAVACARQARKALEKKLATRHSPQALANSRALLAEVLETLGGTSAVRGRRVIAPR